MPAPQSTAEPGDHAGAGAGARASDPPGAGDPPGAESTETAVGARQPAYEPIEDADEFYDEPVELPRRPRRRVLSPLPLALLGILLTACGFIGGVLVEKGQGSSTGSTGAAAAGFASRLGALRGAAAGASSTTGASGPAAGFGGGGLTAGSVAYVSGDTLYLTTAEGNTVKVITSPATTVTKTVKSDVKGIHPGETVAVSGSGEAGGAINAESIRVGGGGLGALFGSGTRAGGSGSTRGGGEPALFGTGGG